MATPTEERELPEGVIEEEAEEYEVPDEDDEEEGDGEDGDEEDGEGGDAPKRRRKRTPEEKAAALQGAMIAEALAKKLSPIIRAAGKIQYAAGLVVKREKMAQVAENHDQTPIYVYRIVSAHHYIPPDKDTLTREEVEELVNKKYVGVQILL